MQSEDEIGQSAGNAMLYSTFLIAGKPASAHVCTMFDYNFVVLLSAIF